MKTLTRYEVKELGAGCEKCQACTASKADVELINSDLSRVYTAMMQRLSVSLVWVSEDDCGYSSAKELRADFFAGTVKAVKFTHPVISNTVYRRYRLIHDILNHALGGLSFSFEDEYESYLAFDKVLQSFKCSDLTRAFIRYDILYKNAMYHYCDGNVPEELAGKLILKPESEVVQSTARYW